jgi:hypothetical protein
MGRKVKRASNMKMKVKDQVVMAVVLIIMLAVMAHRVFHVSAPRHGPHTHATSSWR